MEYSKIRLKLYTLKKVINLVILACLLMALSLSKETGATTAGSKAVHIIAKPLNSFFDSFRAKGKDFTNIFNLKK